MADSDLHRSPQNGLEYSEDTNPSEVEVPEMNLGQTKRLMITHIVNDFFKSYAGKQVLGPFHKVRLNLLPNNTIKDQINLTGNMS